MKSSTQAITSFFNAASQTADAYLPYQDKRHQLSAFFSKLKRVIAESPDTRAHLYDSTKNNVAFIGCSLLGFFVYDFFADHEGEQSQASAMSCIVSLAFSIWFIKQFLDNILNYGSIAAIAAQDNPQTKFNESDINKFLYQQINGSFQLIKKYSLLTLTDYIFHAPQIIFFAHLIMYGEFILNAHPDPHLKKDLPKILVLGGLFQALVVVTDLLIACLPLGPTYFFKPLLMSLYYQYTLLLIQPLRASAVNAVALDLNMPFNLFDQTIQNIFDATTQTTYNWRDNQYLATLIKTAGSPALAFLNVLLDLPSTQLFLRTYALCLSPLFTSKIKNLRSEVLVNLGHQLGWLVSLPGIVKKVEAPGLNLLMSPQVGETCDKVTGIFSSVPAFFNKTALVAIDSDSDCDSFNENDFVDLSADHSETTINHSIATPGRQLEAKPRTFSL